MQPWLRTEEGPQVAQVYVQVPDPRVRQPCRRAFASLKLYMSHTMAGLLHELDQDFREMKSIYNDERLHTVQVVKTGSVDDKGFPI